MWDAASRGLTAALRRVYPAAMGTVVVVLAQRAS
jgi:hypothetical protein